MRFGSALAPLASVLALAVPVQAVAQEARAVLIHEDGHRVGTVVFTQMEHGVLIEAGLIEMTPGVYAMHIHETGACTPDFAAAGGHFAPNDHGHGFDAPDGPHAGDLPNVEILENGRAAVEMFNDRISVADGDSAVLDADGAAVILHADRDSYADEASAGPRIACGVLTPT